MYIYANFDSYHMKKILSAAFIIIAIAFNAKAQTKTAGPAERKLMDSLCIDLGKIDLTQITTKEEAHTAFMDHFTGLAYMLLDVAKERGVDASDQDAMQAIGVEIGQNLVREKCAAFMKLASKMAGVDSKINGSSGVTQGTLKRIETKGFNYFVIAGANGKEQSFLWLRQFSGSEAFTGVAASYAGKKLKIKWLEMEVYLPGAKGYYKVKEITGIETVK